MKILVINAGSSSLKYQLINMEKPQEENNNCLMPGYSYIYDSYIDGDKSTFF